MNETVTYHENGMVKSRCLAEIDKVTGKVLNEILIEFDDRGNTIHVKSAKPGDISQFEAVTKYDSNNKICYQRNLQYGTLYLELTVDSLVIDNKQTVTFTYGDIRGRFTIDQSYTNQDIYDIRESIILHNYKYLDRCVDDLEILKSIVKN